MDGRWLVVVVVVVICVGACNSNGSNDSPPEGTGGTAGAGGVGGPGGAGAGGTGGYAGVAAGGSGGSGVGGTGGTASQVGLPFADCVPNESVVAISPSLLEGVDPHCDDWQDMPPLQIDENGEVRIGSVNASRGFAVSGCRVAYAASNLNVYVYDLATNRQRRVAMEVGASDSIVLQGAVLAYDSVECSEEIGSCISGIEIQRLDTCARGRIGERYPEYRSLKMFGSRVVWYESVDGACQAIGLLDLVTGQTDYLTEVARGVCNSSPEIAGDWLTWSRNEADGTVVMLRNLATGEERQITPSGETNLYPSTDGKFVSWSKDAGAVENIFFYEIATGTTGTVVDAPAMQTGGWISNGTIGWADLRDSSPGEYAFTSAWYERDLPSGEERLVRPARTPLLYARPIGKGLIWLDSREQRPALWAIPQR